MDVILKADVKGLGKKGEKVKASDGYARNFLFQKDLQLKQMRKALQNFVIVNRLTNIKSIWKLQQQTILKQSFKAKQSR